MEDKRSFKVIGMKLGAHPVNNSFKSTTCYEGRYISDTPRGAASKAFSAHCNSKKIRNQCTLIVIIQETTQGSKHKIYQYRAKRKVVNKTVIRDGKEFTFKYENSLKSLKTDPVKNLKQLCKKSSIKKSSKKNSSKK